MYNENTFLGRLALLKIRKPTTMPNNEGMLKLKTSHTITLDIKE